jgi:hypothetical protein
MINPKRNWDFSNIMIKIIGDLFSFINIKKENNKLKDIKI